MKSWSRGDLADGTVGIEQSIDSARSNRAHSLALHEAVDFLPSFEGSILDRVCVKLIRETTFVPAASTTRPRIDRFGGFEAELCTKRNR